MWRGSTPSVMVADALALAMDRLAGKRVPERANRYGAAVIFTDSGVVTIVQALQSLP